MRCVCVFGPTASGKSSLALALAKKFNGVIISADSMQIYKKMDIGTAKPTAAELQEVPHKMIGFLNPSEHFSVYDYKKIAESAILETISAGKLPIIVGGTGLYIDALFHNTDFGEFEIPNEITNQLFDRYQKEGGEILLKELFEIDPETAAPLHTRDVKRIVRAYSVYLATGKTLSQFKKESHRVKSSFQFCKISLVFHERKNLYDRINMRVDEMISSGLIEETRRLYEAGVFDSPTAAQAIGYKELLPHILFETSLEDCISLLKQKTRNYAKRQLTWFRRYDDANLIYMDGSDNPIDRANDIIEAFLKEI